MPQLIRTLTHPNYKRLVERMLDIQGDGLVLSVQLDTKGLIFVGVKEQFRNEDQFRKYLKGNSLPFDDIGQNKNHNYVTRKEETTIEFYGMY